MKAAAEANLSTIKEVLTSGGDVDATDASGWTALMYAAASGHSEPVELLLAAKANPNHRSLNGDTPLMASAISRLFDEDLVHAGADLNAKNSDGTTALMILAAAGEADEVRDALKAGADATLKDTTGRTAQDYLRLANCGKSPVPEYTAFATGEKCDHLDQDDVREVLTLLKAAKRNPRR
jgi:ankyrin repeat protein